MSLTRGSTPSPAASNPDGSADGTGGGKPNSGTEAPTVTPEQANLTEGVELYTRMCSQCHNPVDTSSKKGTIAAKILNLYVRNFPTHKYNAWPNSDEATLIELALAIKKPAVSTP